MSEPIYGRSYRRFAAGSPAKLDFASLCDPMIECEFFVTLSKDLTLDGEELSIEDVARAVGLTHAGIELAEIRFPLQDRPSPMALLTAGSVNGRCIFGPEIGLDMSDLSDLYVELYANDELRETGFGRDVLGHPLAPIAWLAKERARWETFFVQET